MSVYEVVEPLCPVCKGALIDEWNIGEQGKIYFLRCLMCSRRTYPKQLNPKKGSDTVDRKGD